MASLAGVVQTWQAVAASPGRGSCRRAAFNDTQASPQYPGGLALRFARVKRYRDDKTAAQADTLATVRMLYGAQTGAL